MDDAVWGDVLTSKRLVEMVTIDAARVLGLQNVPGSIKVVMVIGGDRYHPYDALLAARPTALRLVMVGAKDLCGDAALQALGPASPSCEAMDVCGTDKFVRVAALA